MLNISVVSLYNGSPVVTNQIRNLIDYIDDEERCLLSKGIWYKFNNDYLSYLRDSIAEIPVEWNESENVFAVFEEYGCVVDIGLALEGDL